MTAEGWRQACEAGVRTVVDLRQDDEVAADPVPTADAARMAGLAVVRADLDGPGVSERDVATLHRRLVG